MAAFNVAEFGTPETWGLTKWTVQRPSLALDEMVAEVMVGVARDEEVGEAEVTAEAEGPDVAVPGAIVM
jgi:hypothetical protein